MAEETKNGATSNILLHLPKGNLRYKQNLIFPNIINILSTKDIKFINILCIPKLKLLFLIAVVNGK
mgnify:CR=1 FL=1